MNRVFISDAVHGMLKGKDYQCIDMLFPSMSSNVDKAAGYIEDAELKNGNTMYSELQLEFYPRSSNGNIDFKLWMSSLKGWVRNWRTKYFFCSNTICS